MLKAFFYIKRNWDLNFSFGYYLNLLSLEHEEGTSQKSTITKAITSLLQI